MQKEENVSDLVNKYNKNDKWQIKSQFLHELYNKNKREEQYDPKDGKGRRLSKYWKEGSTVYSVSVTKMRVLIEKVLNPRTYSWEEASKQKQRFRLYSTYVYLFSIILSIPILIYYPFIKPRINLSKQQYIIHNYQFQHFISTHLSLNLPKVPIRKLKQHLNSINTK